MTVDNDVRNIQVALLDNDATCCVGSREEEEVVGIYMHQMTGLWLRTSWTIVR